MKWSKLFLMLMALAPVVPYAQSIEPVVIASTGEDYSSASARIQFTAGEATTAFLMSPAAQLSEGFHQPDLGPTAIPGRAENKFSVFPNPFTDRIFLTCTTDTDASVRVISPAGIVVLEHEINESGPLTRIDLNHLASGIYILTVTASGQSFIWKLFKL